MKILHSIKDNSEAEWTDASNFGETGRDTIPGQPQFSEMIVQLFSNYDLTELVVKFGDDSEIKFHVEEEPAPKNQAQAIIIEQPKTKRAIVDYRPRRYGT